MNTDGSDLELNFTDANGTVHSFSSFDDIEGFVLAEQDYWDNLTKLVKQSSEAEKFRAWVDSGALLMRQLNPYGADPSNPLEIDPSSERLKNFKRVLRAYEIGRLPTRGSQLAQKLESIKTTSEGDMARELVASQLRAVTLTPLRLSDFQSDVTLETSHQAAYDLRDTLEVAILSARATINETQKLTSTFDSATEDFTKTLTETTTQVAKEAADKAAKQAHAAVTTEMQLREPARYWSDKAKVHRHGSWISLPVFIGLSLGLAALIPNFAVPLAESNAFSQLSTWTWVFAGIGAPALLILWVARTAAKSFNRHQALKADAEERVTMMNAYLALLASGDVNVEDRRVMVAALFRPASVPFDDEPMPGWFGTIFDRNRNG